MQNQEQDEESNAKRDTEIEFITINYIDEIKSNQEYLIKLVEEVNQQEVTINQSLHLLLKLVQVFVTH